MAVLVFLSKKREGGWIKNEKQTKKNTRKVKGMEKRDLIPQKKERREKRA